MSTGQPSIQGIEMLQQVAAKAADDDSYRQRLLDDPAAVLSDAGITVPTGVTVVVHENTDEQIHLVLPTQQLEQLDVDEINVGPLASAVHF